MNVAATYRGRHLLLTGVTGFVGKAFLAWVAVHHPDVRRITCIIRPRSRQKPAERLAGVLASSPMPEAVPDLATWAPDHVGAVAGDLSKPMLGLSEADLVALKGDVDVLINVAAQVDFSPPLDDALTTNVGGALGALEVARRLGVPFVHVSTCYVAGYANGHIAEAVDPGCPNKELKGFDAEAELLLAQRLVERIREDKDDPSQLPARRRLRTEGEARSLALGWPNTYTYTKSLAEKLLMRRKGDVSVTIVRPAIVESAWKFPLPGWSEGGNGMAACLLLGVMGQRWGPGKDELTVDIVPVDLVAKGLALAVAAALNGISKPVYHLGTSHLNPVTMGRVGELTNTWKHRRAGDEGRPLHERLWLTHTDTMNSPRLYDTMSAPTVRAAAGAVSTWLTSPSERAGTRLGRLTRRLKATAEAVERTAKGIEGMYDVYRPFGLEIDVVYRAANIKDLGESLAPDERALYRYDIDDLDWYDYFHHVHLPGLEKWIFPEMVRKMKRAITPDDPPAIKLGDDVIELFLRAVDDHADRPFLGDLTYAATAQRVQNAAIRLVRAGMLPGDAVRIDADDPVPYALLWLAVYAAGGQVDASATRAVTDRYGADGYRQRALLDPTQEPPAKLPDARQRAEVLATLKGISDDLDSSDRVLVVAPLGSVEHLARGLLFPMSRGAWVTWCAPWDDLEAALDEHKPTVVIGGAAVATALDELVNQRIEALPPRAQELWRDLASRRHRVNEALGERFGGVLYRPLRRTVLGSVRTFVSLTPGAEDALVRLADYGLG